MEYYTLDEALDMHFGVKGTPRRDKFDAEVEEALNAYRLGEVTKKARLQENLTQEELGKRAGVHRAQISKLERGHDVSFTTIRRVFRALGVATATLDLGTSIGKLPLW